MATPEGLEPPAYWFEANRSIHLSYGAVLPILSLSLWRLALALDLTIWFVASRCFACQGSGRRSQYSVLVRTLPVTNQAGGISSEFAVAREQLPRVGPHFRQTVH